MLPSDSHGSRDVHHVEARAKRLTHNAFVGPRHVGVMCVRSAMVTR